jgi:hypothetical protein
MNLIKENCGGAGDSILPREKSVMRHGQPPAIDIRPRPRLLFRRSCAGWHVARAPVQAPLASAVIFIGMPAVRCMAGYRPGRARQRAKRSALPMGEANPMKGWDKYGLQRPIGMYARARALVVVKPPPLRQIAQIARASASASFSKRELNDAEGV